MSDSRYSTFLDENAMIWGNVEELVFDSLVDSCISKQDLCSSRTILPLFLSVQRARITLYNRNLWISFRDTIRSHRP